MSQKIFLIGLPGAGKTTMGLELALHLGIQFVDLDQEIEKSTNRNISSIFEQEGEAHFRQLEHIHLKKIIDEVPKFVMATGGGTPCFFDNLNMMKTAGTTIFIQTPIEVIKERICQDDSRPLMKFTSLEMLYEKRKDWYNQADEKASSLKDLIHLFD